MKIEVINGVMSQEEIDATVKLYQDKHPDYKFTSFTFEPDGEFVNVKYTYSCVPFERIRRITGYLVGTLDRFNDAKRAEVEDRVAHM